MLVFLLLHALGLEDSHIPTFWLPLYTERVQIADCRKVGEFMAHIPRSEAGTLSLLIATMHLCLMLVPPVDVP